MPPSHFASTFPTGFEEIVQKALQSNDPQVHIQTIQDGLVLYESQLNHRIIRGLPFFNNTFLVLSFERFENTSNIKKIVDLLFRNTQLSSITSVIQSLKTHSFRFMVTKENRIQPMQPYQRNILESIVSKILKLRVDRTNPGTEIWFFIRRDGTSFCGLRLTKREKRGKGELGKEVTYSLNFLSEPKDNDIFLDPFVGSGAIPLSRVIHFPYKEIIAFDHDKQKVNEVIQRLKKFHDVRIIQGDALRMNKIQDRSVDVIVTDPPWGLFEKLETNSSTFYFNMLREMERILKQDGRAIILTACKDEMQRAFGRLNWYSQKTFNVLISGKKVGVYQMIKTMA